MRGQSLEINLSEESSHSKIGCCYWSQDLSALVLMASLRWLRLLRQQFFAWQGWASQQSACFLPSQRLWCCHICVPSHSQQAHQRGSPARNQESASSHDVHYHWKQQCPSVRLLFTPAVLGCPFHVFALLGIAMRCLDIYSTSWIFCWKAECGDTYFPIWLMHRVQVHQGKKNLGVVLFGNREKRLILDLCVAWARFYVHISFQTFMSVALTVAWISMRDLPPRIWGRRALIWAPRCYFGQINSRWEIGPLLKSL